MAVMTNGPMGLSEKIHNLYIRNILYIYENRAILNLANGGAVF